ncbi:MAG: hypothetical protein HGB00_04465 [Chlorobiaceae bacterium]|nr:hypothetical protein [Chlorobiaceae bacterium]
MKRSTEQRNAEVDRTLRILDEIPRLEVHHLFRARVLQRVESLDNSNTFAVAMAGGFNPRLAFFGLLLILNIASAMLLFMHKTPQSTISGSAGIAEVFSEDYGGPALSYYDQPSADR